MGEMVERVARAMWDEREKQFPNRVRLKFDPMPGDPIWAMARAAIAAMREPSEAMQCAGDEAIIEAIQPGQIIAKVGDKWISPAMRCHSAMIDAALAERERVEG